MVQIGSSLIFSYIYFIFGQVSFIKILISKGEGMCHLKKKEKRNMEKIIRSGYYRALVKIFKIKIFKALI